MTQCEFYNLFSNLELRADQQTVHQRLIKDLRDRDFSWEQISVVIESLGAAE